MKPADKPKDLPDECVSACIEAIDRIIKSKGLVIDDDDEIFDEYRHKLSLNGQPGIGDFFLRWVHDNRYSFPAGNRVSITRTRHGYKEFPDHPGLTGFDPSDRKFVAVANAHPAKPPIYQATDSKWLGWKKALAEAGITVEFLCKDYVTTKYRKKMPS